MDDKLKLKLTPRGFARADFEDLYGSRCSIQESSLATRYAIWLGVDEGSPYYETQEGIRMHLSQEQVKALLPLLKRFVQTGRL